MREDSQNYMKGKASGHQNPSNQAWKASTRKGSSNLTAFIFTANRERRAVNVPANNVRSENVCSLGFKELYQELPRLWAKIIDRGHTQG